jgi:2-oxoisovalerate dehydrogenase E2 component (dihydrolipoyl transacylase)
MGELVTFALPDLGEGLTSASIVEWCVAVGDSISRDDRLVVVETQKAEVEIPCPCTGTVVERLGDEGDEIPVGSVLVRIETDEDAELSPETARPMGRPWPPVLVGYGPRHEPAPPAGSTRPMCSPPVRKLAADLGVDLASVAPGTGPGGRIVRADVERAVGVAGSASSTVVPIRGVRARIAEQTATSRREIPDATAATWADATALVVRRDQLRDAPELGGARLTPFALLLRLVVVALGEQPAVNATLDAAAGEIHLHHAVHLGVAVATPKGLVVPVIRDASRRTYAEIATELERLREGALRGALGPGELFGSTFTVSNAGAFGIDEGIPVINHPEVAVLGVGAIRRRPWVVGDELAVRHTVKLTCAFDHRACDGAEAGGFLRRLADLIEQPEPELRWEV